jgi:hypothetical protein
VAGGDLQHRAARATSLGERSTKSARRISVSANVTPRAAARLSSRISKQAIALSHPAAENLLDLNQAVTLSRTDQI